MLCYSRCHVVCIRKRHGIQAGISQCKKLIVEQHGAAVVVYQKCPEPFKWHNVYSGKVVYAEMIVHHKLADARLLHLGANPRYAFPILIHLFYLASVYIFTGSEFPLSYAYTPGAKL